MIQAMAAETGLFPSPTVLPQEPLEVPKQPSRPFCARPPVLVSPADFRTFVVPFRNRRGAFHDGLSSRPV